MEDTESGRGRKMERARRKRVRWRGLVVACSKKHDPVISSAEMVHSVAETDDETEEEKRRVAEMTLASDDRFYAIEASQFRDSWNRLWSGYFGSFEDTTRIEPMRFTYEPPPRHASTGTGLQVFSVKVAGTRGGLQWPLHMFGLVALRDCIDFNRNIIFQRARDDCQILTEQDPYLVLTGPTRSVVSLGTVTFEVELIVKGRVTSEDKGLISLAVPLMHDKKGYSYMLNSAYTSKLSTLELTHGYLTYSVEAYRSVQVIKGALLDSCRVQFAASTTAIGQEKAILLNSGDGEVPVTDDGNIQLSRHVASVETNGKLKVSVKVWRDDDNFVEKVKCFRPKKSNASAGMLDVGFCKMKVTVAWSLLPSEHHIYKSL